MQWIGLTEMHVKLSVIVTVCFGPENLVRVRDDDDNDNTFIYFYMDIQMRFTGDLTTLLMSAISNPAVYNLLKYK